MSTGPHPNEPQPGQDHTPRPPSCDDEPMLQWFGYAQLPPRLQAVSVEFYNLACKIVATAPRNAERTVALRKLLEAKDCAVRAHLYVAPRIGA